MPYFHTLFISFILSIAFHSFVGASSYQTFDDQQNQSIQQSQPNICYRSCPACTCKCFWQTTALAVTLAAMGTGIAYSVTLNTSSNNPPPSNSTLILPPPMSPSMIRDELTLSEPPVQLLTNNSVLTNNFDRIKANLKKKK